MGVCGVQVEVPFPFRFRCRLPTPFSVARSSTWHSIHCRKWQSAKTTRIKDTHVGVAVAVAVATPQQRPRWAVGRMGRPCRHLLPFIDFWPCPWGVIYAGCFGLSFHVAAVAAAASCCSCACCCCCPTRLIAFAGENPTTVC